jgi:hypothetical protein
MHEWLTRLTCGLANGRSDHLATGATAPAKCVRQLRIQQELRKTELAGRA